MKDVVDREPSEVRWFVFGDDDTVFFVDNLVTVLSNYDHESWVYVGGRSESYEQNVANSFDMAFGGGGFAISSSLARVLARVSDSCLMRYGHLYGSDSRVFSCLAELGIGLTHEPGFHQVDLRGNLFGMLSAHPLSPLLSLHHLDAVDPLFPNMNRTQALTHLFRAAKVDPARVLQQTVCYDRTNSLTVSISWGYAVQIYDGNQLLPDLLPLQRTFVPWRRRRSINGSFFMFNTRDYPKDPCERPTIFFFNNITSNADVVDSKYRKHTVENCFKPNSIRNLKQVRVFSKKLEVDRKQIKVPRRQCCDILPSVGDMMTIKIRNCGTYELISMST